MKKQYCRTCALYDLDSIKTKTGRVMSNSVAQCNWEPEQVKLPASAWRVLPIRVSWMQPNDGADCACWVKREAA